MSDNTKIRKYTGNKQKNREDLDTAMIRLAEVYAYRSGRRHINIGLQSAVQNEKARRKKLKVVVKEPAKD